MEHKKNDISAYIARLTLLLLGLLFFAFPLLFATVTTDNFLIPKQGVLAAVTLLSLLLVGVKMIAERSVRLSRTPFDLPVVALLVAALLSALFSRNLVDSLIAFVPFLFAGLLYFITVNSVRLKSALTFLFAANIIGVTLAAAIHILAYLNIYIFPYDFTRKQTFTPIGSLLDHAIYLGFMLPLVFSFISPLFTVKGIKESPKQAPLFFGGASALFIVFVSLTLSVYQLTFINQPKILNLETGFQTAFAAISQDTGRVLQGFLFGSGFGTYFTDFTRFKQATYNLDPVLWSYQFVRSSSFALELLATTGILGAFAFLFLVSRIIKEIRLSLATKEFQKASLRVSLLALMIVIIAAFLLPFTFSTMTALFFVLALFAARSGFNQNDRYFDTEIQFVAARHGFLPLAGYTVSPEGIMHTEPHHRKNGKVLPVLFFLLTLITVGVLGFFSISYVIADMTFQHSFVAAAQNNSLQTYNDQQNAIKIFPFRDGFRRVHSQTNLLLANSLATALANQQKTGDTNQQKTQQTIYTLIQQAISEGRIATTLSPFTTTNWQNLATIYRSLIGFGQNAESFALITQQQATVLDPNNPQNYINLGGIYYQLKQWDNAQNQFQVAVRLKQDYANAYYNLGHALESKGELQAALTQYKTVKLLTDKDSESQNKITAEIEALEHKIGAAAAQSAEKTTVEKASAKQDQQELGIDKPTTQLPQQKPPVVIPGPEKVSPTPSATGTPSASPTAALTTTP